MDETIQIFLISDSRYGLQLYVLIRSIIENNHENMKIKFNIVDGGISENIKEEILKLIFSTSKAQIVYYSTNNSPFSIELNKVYATSKAFKKKYISQVALNKFILPILDPTVDKLLYLDCDMIVLDSLKGLWETDISDYIAAAVPDFKLSNSNFNKKIGFTKENIYFNTGCILINAKRYRDDLFFDKALSLLFGFNSNRFVDQDHLNILFKNNIKVIDYRYNLFSYFPYGIENGIPISKYAEIENVEDSIAKMSQLRKAITEPCIIHFVTRRKPWNSHEGFYFKEWRETIIGGALEREFINQLLGRLSKYENMEYDKWYLFGRLPLKEKITRGTKYCYRKIITEVKRLIRIQTQNSQKNVKFNLK